MNNIESKAYIAYGPKDYGPLYKETDMSRFPVEPFNTFSNLIFLLLVIYWSWKTRLNTVKHPLTTVCMPILLLGFIGGTVFHATRSSSIWLQLDVMPILVLALSAGIFLWRMLVRKWVWTFLLTLGPWTIYFFISKYVISVPEKYAISIGYVVLASNILLPAVLFCVLRNRQAWLTLTLCLASFAVAVTFRMTDRLDIAFLPQGTHFLWHIFGGICSFFMIKYIYLAEDIEVKERQGRSLRRNHK